MSSSNQETNPQVNLTSANVRAIRVLVELAEESTDAYIRIAAASAILDSYK